MDKVCRGSTVGACDGPPSWPSVSTEHRRGSHISPRSPLKLDNASPNCRRTPGSRVSDTYRSHDWFRHDPGGGSGGGRLTPRMPQAWGAADEAPFSPSPFRGSSPRRAFDWPEQPTIEKPSVHRGTALSPQRPRPDSCGDNRPHASSARSCSPLGAAREEHFKASVMRAGRATHRSQSPVDVEPRCGQDDGLQSALSGHPCTRRGKRDTAAARESQPPDDNRPQRRVDFPPGVRESYADAAAPSTSSRSDPVDKSWGGTGGDHVWNRKNATECPRAGSPGCRQMHRTSSEVTASLMPGSTVPPQAPTRYLIGSNIVDWQSSGRRQSGTARGNPQLLPASRQESSSDVSEIPVQQQRSRDHRNSDMVRDMWSTGPATVVQAAVPVVYATGGTGPGSGAASTGPAHPRVVGGGSALPSTLPKGSGYTRAGLTVVPHCPRTPGAFSPNARRTAAASWHDVQTPQH